MAKKLTTSDLQKKLNTLSLSEILTMLNAYSKATGIDIESAKNQLVTDDLQNRLIANNINSCCPACGSISVVGYGSNGNIKRSLTYKHNKTTGEFKNEQSKFNRLPLSKGYKIKDIKIIFDEKCKFIDFIITKKIRLFTL